jgi:hypothetical protein
MIIILTKTDEGFVFVINRSKNAVAKQEIPDKRVVDIMSGYQHTLCVTGNIA